MQRSQDTYTTQLQTNIIKVLLGERSGDKADKETEREKRESAEKEEREKSSVSSKFAGCCLLDSKVVVFSFRLTCRKTALLWYHEHLASLDSYLVPFVCRVNSPKYEKPV